MSIAGRWGSAVILTRRRPCVSPIVSLSALCRITIVREGGLRMMSSGLSIADTPLGQEAAADLLDGLDVYSIPASGDGHPLALYGIQSQQQQQQEPKLNQQQRKPILLLHGRTWSSVPVYHLLGGPANRGHPGRESRSLMEALYDAEGLQPYCMDFRGFGGTPRDSTGVVDPSRCVSDVESALQFILNKHPATLPALLGWSQGALIAQLLAQRDPRLISKLVLYGSIYNPIVTYPRTPLYNLPANSSNSAPTEIPNQYHSAIEDFTIEGTIPPEPARLFAQAALRSDPIKATWFHTHEFNNCDPGRVHVPTLVIAGDQDPYAPLHVQGQLFTGLGRGEDRTWSVIANADHAVHMLDGGRERFVSVVASFVENLGTKRQF